MLTLGIFVGLILGLAAGGSLANLASVRLRWIWALSLAVIVRFLTEAALTAGVDIVETLRVPLLAAAFGILLAGLWANRSFPGLSIAFVGILSNAVVILVNGGYMPIWLPSLEMAGFQPSDVHSAIHVILPPRARREFPAPSRAFERHHPDPVPGDPERRVGGRRLPDGGPRLLPVRCNAPTSLRARSAFARSGRDPPRPASRRPSPRVPPSSGR